MYCNDTKLIKHIETKICINCKVRDYDATEYYGYSLMYFIDTPINNGNREQTKQGMLRSPVGAIAPGGSSCVSIFMKRIIGTAM